MKTLIQSTIIIIGTSSAFNCGHVSAFTMNRSHSSFQDCLSFGKSNRMSRGSYIFMMKELDEESDENHEKQIKASFLPSQFSRRSLMTTTITSTIGLIAAASSSPLPSSAAESSSKQHISASWKAVDGLNSLDSSQKFVSFESSAYTAMVNDPARTPFFEKAIVQRLKQQETERTVVLDLGTGPYALFAIVAAKAGASKVYAIEANPEAAQSARRVVKQAGFDNVITVLEGFSTDITLPEPVDFAVAEIVGSVATEEGAYATIVDAQKFLKEPKNPSNWIPNRIQTWAAPASYTLHNLLQPPEFDWSKLQGEPVRFNCRDEGLQLLADPILVEDLSFADILMNNKKTTDLKFTIDGNRVDDNAVAFYDEFRKNSGMTKTEAANMAVVASQSLSGIALWPRLVLDGSGSIEVNSRSYPNGGHQKSHWQTVLPIMCDLPVHIQGGDEVFVTVDFNVFSGGSGSVQKPPSYRLEGDIIRK